MTVCEDIVCERVMIIDRGDFIHFIFSDGIRRAIPRHKFVESAITSNGIRINQYRIPRKVQNIVVDAWISGKCPSCLETVFDEDKFCKHCGQALKWDIPKEE